MKSSTFIVFCFCVITFCNSCKIINDEEIKSLAKKNAQLYCSSFSCEDYESLASFYPQMYFESDLERIGFIANMKEESKQLHKQGIYFDSISVSGLDTFYRDKSMVQAIFPFQYKVYTTDSSMWYYSSLFCLSFDDGEEWSVLDYETLKSTFPDFKYVIKPCSELCVVKDTCKHFMLNVFGEEMSVDRYLESNKFVIGHEDFGKYVMTLIKVNPELLSKKELLDIENSVFEWKESNANKFEIMLPKIDNSSVCYHESHMGLANIYSVYKIPFSYKKTSTSGQFERDTIYGCFGSEHIFSDGLSVDNSPEDRTGFSVWEEWTMLNQE